MNWCYLCLPGSPRQKAQHVLCVVWMSEWCLFFIGSLFTLGFIFRACPLSQSTFDLQQQHWDHKYPWKGSGTSRASITNTIKASKTNMSSVWLLWQRKCQMVMVSRLCCQRLNFGTLGFPNIDISISVLDFWDFFG